MPIRDFAAGNIEGMSIDEIIQRYEDAQELGLSEREAHKAKTRKPRKGSGRGHMPGLAKHLAKKLGGDPHFFSKCMDDPELAGYDEATRGAICARAHYLVTGIWPGSHGGDNSAGPEGGETSLPRGRKKENQESLLHAAIRQSIAESFDPDSISLKGGAGSGSFGHAGRPGKVGGQAANSADPKPKGVPGNRTDGKGNIVKPGGKKVPQRPGEGETEAKPESRPESKPKPKTEPKPEPKTEPKPRSESKPVDKVAQPQDRYAKFDLEKWSSIEDVGERVEKFNALGNAEMDAQADAPRSIPRRQKEILGSQGRPNTGNLKKDLADRVEQYKDQLPDEAQEKIQSTIDEFDSILEKAGVDETKRRRLSMDAADSLIAQDVEGQARQLGDHGIHHIRGNIENAVKILNQVPGADSPETLAEVYAAMIYHDTGYLTEPSRTFLDGRHKYWSREHFDQNVRPSLQQALGRRAAGHISTLIETHDGMDINWETDPVASAIRVADNIALFRADKLPPIFRVVPANIGVLEQLASKSISVAEARYAMIENIQAAGLSPKIEKQLLGAVKEVSGATPKFTLGMLGGEVDGYTWMTGKKGESGHLLINLRENSEITRLNKLGDFGQKQFGKFAKSFGHDPKKFVDSLEFDARIPPGEAGKLVMRTRIVGRKKEKDLADHIRKNFWFRRKQ